MSKKTVTVCDRCGRQSKVGNEVFVDGDKVRFINKIILEGSGNTVQGDMVYVDLCLDCYMVILEGAVEAAKVR